MATPDPRPETDAWPYVPARWQTPVTSKREVDLIVIHCMEAPEKGNTAENVGLYFKNHPGFLIVGTKKIVSKPSAHVGVDSNSTVQYVKDNNVAWAAPGANHNGIHIELAGVSAQTAKEWADPYSILTLERAADVAAQYCLKYGIQAIKLTPLQLGKGFFRGIIGHIDATNAFKPNSGHTDPGTGFPWQFFLERVAYHRDRRLQQFVPQLNT